ncbi:MAG: 50S ribosomal protein L11 methyltransferase, partial [Rhodospirillales bacterium]|nr:50S ribosomal protein L11 methyltransferase [Rhodospirillales bacterium]
PLCAVVSSFLIPPDDTLSRLQGISETTLDEAAIASKLAALASDLNAEISDFQITAMADQDWVADNLAAFPPIQVGRYFMYGSHIQEGMPGGAVGIKLDAGPAFGTGEHATTEGCLAALDQLAKEGKKFRRILDMGCGSGILSLAAAKTWQTGIIACDIDPGAVRVACENARQNSVGGFIYAQAGDGYRTPLVQTQGPYDLIVSNILANPLCQMARDLRRYLDVGGMAVLSGFLVHDARRVAQHHVAAGLKLRRKIVVDGWTTLIMYR